MIQTTVRAILHGDHNELTLNGIYLVRDGDCVLYVGRSFDVVERIIGHIEHWANSPLGDVIRINASASLAWQVELREPEECREVVRQVFCHETEVIAIETAERAMILSSHPCLNTANNVRPGRLADHIKRYPVELEPGITDNLY